VTYDQVFHTEKFPASSQSQPLWLDRVAFNPDARRVFFASHFLDGKDPRKEFSAGFTIGADGSDLRCLLAYAHLGAAWCDWVDNRRLAAVRLNGKSGAPHWSHLLFSDGQKEPQTLDRSDHVRCSPDGKWVGTDNRYGFRTKHQFHLVNLQTGKSAKVAGFIQPKGAPWVGLTPAWAPDSRRICVESLDRDGRRQLYLLQLTLPREAPNWSGLRRAAGPHGGSEFITCSGTTSWKVVATIRSDRIYNLLRNDKLETCRHHPVRSHL
jgi:hypothetical protein